jgi:PAS domain S-box-containing protein
MNEPKPVRILVVDDTEETRYSLARLLKRSGFEVIEAATGREALELARACPDLVVLDVHLPDLSGIEVSRRLKQDALTRDIPILQISATFTLTTHKIEGLDAGADVYLATPVDPDELLAHVRTLMRLKETQDTLRESEARFRTLADNIAQFAWMADPQGSIFWFNQRWYDFTGTTLEEMRGWGWQKVHHPDHVTRATGKFREHVSAGRVWEDTFPLRAKDGTYRWFLSRAVPIRNERGEVVRWFGTNTDITDQLEAQEEVRRARDELARVNEELESRVEERTARLRETVGELEQFSYSLTHDLRAPLRAMQAFSTVIEEDFANQLPPELVNHLHRIRGAARRMDLLIQDSLNYSKLVRHELPLKTVNLGTLLRGLVETYPNLQAPEVDIRVELDNVQVQGNESALIQIFSNLLGNAVKFVAPGTKPCVRVWNADPPVTEPGDVGGANAVAQKVMVCVEDNGIGIPREAHTKIFGMFQRLHRSDEYPGTGIGLAIVRKSLDRIGGRISLESEPGKGSRFWVELRKA